METLKNSEGISSNPEKTPIEKKEARDVGEEILKRLPARKKNESRWTRMIDNNGDEMDITKGRGGLRAFPVTGSKYDHDVAPRVLMDDGQTWARRGGRVERNWKNYKDDETAINEGEALDVGPEDSGTPPVDEKPIKVETIPPKKTEASPASSPEKPKEGGARPEERKPIAPVIEVPKPGEETKPKPDTAAAPREPIGVGERGRVLGDDPDEAELLDRPDHEIDAELEENKRKIDEAVERTAPKPEYRRSGVAPTDKPAESAPPYRKAGLPDDGPRPKVYTARTVEPRAPIHTQTVAVESPRPRPGSRPQPAPATRPNQAPAQPQKSVSEFERMMNIAFSPDVIKRQKEEKRKAKEEARDEKKRQKKEARDQKKAERRERRQEAERSEEESRHNLFEVVEIEPSGESSEHRATELHSVSRESEGETGPAPIVAESHHNGSAVASGESRFDRSPVSRGTANYREIPHRPIGESEPATDETERRRDLFEVTEVGHESDRRGARRYCVEKQMRRLKNFLQKTKEVLNDFAHSTIDLEHAGETRREREERLARESEEFVSREHRFTAPTLAERDTTDYGYRSEGGHYFERNDWAPSIEYPNPDRPAWRRNGTTETASDVSSGSEPRRRARRSETHNAYSAYFVPEEESDPSDYGGSFF